MSTSSKELRAELEKANQSYWAGQVEVQILAAQAWMAQAKGNKERGAEVHARGGGPGGRSEKHVAMENRLYPMRELIGDLLMVGEPRAAL